MHPKKAPASDAPGSIRYEPEERRCHDFRLDQLGAIEASLSRNKRHVVVAEFNTFDAFSKARPFNNSRVAKVECKMNPAATDHSEEGRGFQRTRLALSPPRPELLSVPPHDCGRRLQSDADAAALVNIGAFGGNAPDHIFGGQYCCHRLPP